MMIRPHRVLLPTLLLVVSADASHATTKCIVGGSCGDPPPPHGGGGSGSSSGGVSGPPAPDPRVAGCVAASPPPATCQPILAAEIQRQRVYGVAPTRDMFHPDTANPYPDNMGTAVSSNLLPHVGAASNAAPQNDQLATNTDLTYHSILVADWARAKGGSLLPDYSTASNWAPHALNGDPSYVSSCQEWVYRKWWSPYGGPSWIQDQLAACGVDGECLLTTALESPDSPFWNGAAAVTVPATPARASTTVPIAVRQSTVVPKNPFYEVNGALFENQDSAIVLALENGASTCAQGGLQGPFTPDPSDVTNFVPTKYTDGNTAANVALLESWMFAPPVYLIGPSYPSAPAGSPVVAQYPSEWQMDTALWQNRILPGAPLGRAAAYAQDDPFEVAMRDRVQHLRELQALYASLTHFTCADVAAAFPNGGGTGSSGGSGGGGGGGGGCGSAFGCGSSSGGPPKPAPQIATSGPLADRIAAAREVQDEIVSFVLQEYDRGDEGCFGPHQTACDVDPFEVTGRLVASFDAPQEQDFRTCVQWTANAFGTMRVTDVDALITQRMNAARQRLLNAPGIDPASDATIGHPVPVQSSSATTMTTSTATTQAPVQRDAVGQVITGSRYMGDPDLAGGGYSYGAYWKVTPSDFAGPPGVSNTPTACELDGAVHGELHGRIDLLRSIGDQVCSPVDATLDGMAAQGLGFSDPQVNALLENAASSLSSIASAFGIPDVVSFCEARYRLRHLADAYLTAKAVPGQVSYDGELFFGGTQLWGPKDAAASPNVTASWPAEPTKVQGPQTTIVVVVVPVTFDLYGEIQYGASGFADAQSTVSCSRPSLEAHVGFTPWVTVDAIGSVGIGFTFAQAGIRGKIRVLDAKLPLDARVAVQPDASTGNLELVAGAHANLELAMMSGSLSAFAELNLGVVDEEAEAQLASWDGLHTTVPILNWDLQPIALPAFDQATWNQFQTTTQQGP